MSRPAATVAIPVLNGIRYLPEVLDAIRSQTERPELLIVDSGSTDGSLELARRHADRLIEIPPTEFSHGGTRNLAVAEARGQVVAFLTQDAAPASDRWLASMLEGFDQAEDVALVFGPHLARPDASHMIAREMEAHFSAWGGGTDIDVQRIEGPEALAAYRREPWRWQFFSDVNGAVARWAWEQVPYREVRYAEDQLIAREMIERGWAKVFHPGAAVYHSHDYPPVAFFRRYFDEFRSLREVLGHVEDVNLEHVASYIWHSTRFDRHWLRERGVGDAALRRATARSALHYLLRALGAGLGTRADRVPPRLRQAISLEGRSSFEPVDVPDSPLLDREPPAARFRTDPDDPYDFVRRAFPRRPLLLDPPEVPIADKPALTFAWVVPPWSRGSGGHTTIFRLVRKMEERGHRCAVFVFDPVGRATDRSSSLEHEVNRWFVELDAPVFSGLDPWIGADVAIATNWWTAYPVRDLPGCREKVYLVQDFEPAFYPYSAEYLWAEETYRMGYRGIAYTPWMAEILREDYEMESGWFECGTDLETYAFGEQPREPATVAVYARRETARRAVELSLEALSELKRRRPEVRVVTFGSNLPVDPPFEVQDLGVVAPGELARLYRRATVGVALSLTTHSLVGQEMMASGLPVVELAGRNVSSALGPPGHVVAQAAPDPISLADEIERVLEDRAGAQAMAARARRFVEERDWERSADQFEQAVRGFLASPRTPPEPAAEAEVAATLGGQRPRRTALADPAFPGSP